MKPLPETFRKSGYDYALLNRVGDVAMFSQSQEGRVVVVVQHHKASVIMGKPVPEREAMPSTEQWGSAGWTCPTPERAREKMDEIVAREAAREEARAA